MSSQIKEILNATSESTLVVTNQSVTPPLVVTVNTNYTLGSSWEVPDNENEALSLKLETSAHSNEMLVWSSESTSNPYHLHYKSGNQDAPTSLEIPADSTIEVSFETVGGIIIIGTADITEE